MKLFSEYLSQPSSLFLLLAPAVIGCFLGLFIVLDPFFTAVVTDWIDITIEGKNIVKLYPYELSTLLFFFIFILLIAKKVLVKITIQPAKACIILILVTLFTIGLHRVDPFDGTDVVFSIILFALLIQSLVRNERLSFTFIDFANLLLLFCILLSAINGKFVSLLKTSLMIKLSMFSFLITNLIYKINHKTFFIRWLITITSISAMIAILQEVIYLSTGIALVGRIQPEELRFMFEATSLGTFLRVPAFIVSYKTFAFLLITNLLIIFNFLLYSPFKEDKLKSYASYFSLFFVMLGALVCTFSRDSMLALFFGIFLSLLIRWSNFIIHGILGFLVLCLVIYITGSLDDIYNAVYHELHVSESRVRLQLAREGISGVIRHPWIGIGASQGVRYTSHYLFWPAHNNFILVTDELGLLGFFVYLMPVGYTVFSLIALNIRVTDLKEQALMRGLLCGVLALLLVLQSHAGYLDIVLWMYMGIVQGMVLLFRYSSYTS